MSDTIHIRLHNIGENLQPGDAVECTVDGEPYKAEFVRHGGHNRLIWVRIYGIYEIRSGVLAFAPPMFPNDYSYVDEFTVNDAPGQPWHRTASTGYWQ
jgi:hypothetical protein